MNNTAIVRKLAGGFGVVVLGLAGLLVSFWYLGGRRIVETLVQNRTQPWAVFHVPENPTALDGMNATLTGKSIRLCNGSNVEWSKVLVQIDQGYLAALDRLPSGECRSIPIHDFATESWKRLPPPRDLQVTQVAVLATVLQKAYSKKLLTN